MKYKFINDKLKYWFGLLLFLIIISLTFVYAFNFNSNIFTRSGELKVTEEHPFFINNSWIVAKDLHVGDLLTNINGNKVRIVGIKDVNVSDGVDVYNLEVKNYSNFVLFNGVIVHNSNRIVNPEGVDCIGGSCKVRVLYPDGTVEQMSLGKFYYKFENNPNLKLINAYGEVTPLEDLVRISNPDQNIKMVSFTVEGQTYKVTENTRVQLASGEYVLANELVPGTRLRVPGSKGEVTALNQYERKGITVYEPKFTDSVYDTPFQLGGGVNGPTVKNPYPTARDGFLDSVGYGESATRKQRLYGLSDETIAKDIEVLVEERPAYDAVIDSATDAQIYDLIRDLDFNKGKIFDNPILKNNQILLSEGKPANGQYMWTLDETGKLTLGNRESRQQFLPHASLAEGKRVFGAGEIFIENGKIIEINPKSGHYLPTNRADPVLESTLQARFSEESLIAFRKYLKANGFSNDEISGIIFNSVISRSNAY